MELPGSAYLYTLATLSMTFAGFCAIVIVLRQTIGKEISGFHVVLMRLYLESQHRGFATFKAFCQHYGHNYKTRHQALQRAIEHLRPPS